MVKMSNVTSWVVTPSNLVDKHRRFEGTYHLSTMKMEAVRRSKTYVTPHRTTPRHNQKTAIDKTIIETNVFWDRNTTGPNCKIKKKYAYTSLC